MSLYFQFVTIVCSALDFLQAPVSTIVAICDDQHLSINEVIQYTNLYLVSVL
jgi:hypothetical protein